MRQKHYPPIPLSLQPDGSQFDDHCLIAPRITKKWIFMMQVESEKAKEMIQRKVIYVRRKKQKEEKDKKCITSRGSSAQLNAAHKTESFNKCIQSTQKKYRSRPIHPVPPSQQLIPSLSYKIQSLSLHPKHASISKKTLPSSPVSLNTTLKLNFAKNHVKQNKQHLKQFKSARINRSANDERVTGRYIQKQQQKIEPWGQQFEFTSMIRSPKFQS